jgi:hypothetical protein
MFLKLSSAAFAAALLCAGSATAAPVCALNQIASLPITTTASGKIAVPVKIAGRDVLMAVELGAGTTGVNANLIEQMKLDTTPIRDAEAAAGLGGWGTPGAAKFIYQDDVFTNGITTVLQRKVNLAEFQIGALDIKDYPMFAMPAWTNADGIVGVLGTSMLSHVDVELDFQNAKMNLFLPTQCTNPVYWSNSFAVLPLELNSLTGEATSPLSLDGKTLQGAFSTDPGHGEMSLFVATNVLGISISDPRVKEAGIKANSDDLKIYRYPFKSLTLNGISIQDPMIDLTTDRPATDIGDCADIKLRGGWYSGSGQEKGASAMCATDLTIRLDELRKLHLYFAFSEKKLYVTAADARK